MVGLLLFVCVGALLRASPLSSACPAGCECSEAAQTVKCVSKELQSIPPGIPGYARNLFITGNRISRIAPGSFRGLENVTNLSLSNNRITEVQSQAFSSLRGLRSLDLSGNQLFVIHPEAFVVSGGSLRELNLSRALYNRSCIGDLAVALRWGALGSLLTLDLSGNRLVLLPSSIFGHVPNLRRLVLANNSLVTVHNGSFSGLERLELLDLTHNSLKTFGEDALGEFEQLSGALLLLGDNPYACTCGVEDFAAWLNSSRAHMTDAERLVCTSPAALRGTPILGLGGQILGCHDGPVGEGARLALQTSYAFLGVVLGFVGVIFLFVLYLNRRGIKKWIVDTRDACRDVLEGYHYRYEIDSDPRLAHISTSGDL
ncbi:trophoblast glycoprotein-like [Brienomyrus brachyistius]|uniref:trophoblast glycoprotein-like n=1 Tax=Brienomyrus brachyistius TaxID=42636 RepID=UPI0020B2F3E1|nr:trophoblast glycoprotein-like [Brienomyrus brachyistius]